MRFLTSLPTWQVLIGSIILTAVFAYAATWLAGRFLRGNAGKKAGATAASYMTAFGSLFAILTGFLIQAEYSTYRAAQNALGVEVAAATQLASASTVLPAADTDRIQSDLNSYLDSLLLGEWTALSQGVPARSPSTPALRALQQEVFNRASKEYVSDSVARTLQDSINKMTTARRDRIVLASQTLPVELFGLAVVAGLGLIVNAVLIANREGRRRYALVATGIVLAVALDLGAIVVISAPFRGGLQVSTDPIAELSAEISEGFYLPWAQTR